MNNIRQIQELNQKELDAGIPPSASWHTDFQDSAFIYIGGLPFSLTEGDILTIFSQYGTPTFINLIRDAETGKSKGFCFLKYADQRSTALAVDNLGGAEVLGRVLRVDHTRYQPKEGKDGKLEGMWVDQEEEEESEEEVEKEVKREPLLKEEIELRKLETEMDEEDPMKEYLVAEKRKEVEEARETREKEKRKEKEKSRHKNREHHHRSSRRDRSGNRDRRRSRDRSSRAIKERGEEGSHRHRHRSKDRESGRDKERDRDRKRGGDGERKRSRSPRDRKDSHRDRDNRRHRSRERDGEDGSRRSYRDGEDRERGEGRRTGDTGRRRYRSRSP